MGRSDRRSRFTGPAFLRALRNRRAHLESGGPEAGPVACRRSLELHPCRPTRLLDAARVAPALEDEEEVAAFHAALVQIAARGSDRPGLEKLEAKGKRTTR